MKNIIFLFIFIIAASCKKENLDPVIVPDLTTSAAVATPDTISSSQWLMAFPGSYWTYDNGFTDTVGNYVLESYCNDYNPSDDVYVPTYRNTKLFGNYTFANYCYHKNYVFDAEGDSSEQPGTVVIENGYCLSIDTSMTVSGIYYDSVQKVVFTLTFVPDATTGISQISYYQYGIGCIRTELYNPYSGTLEEERNLGSYYISPH